MKLFTRQDAENNCNWLWIQSNLSTRVVAWDKHLDGIKIYSDTTLQGNPLPPQKMFKKTPASKVKPVISKLFSVE